jgi:hypothetical protein
MRRDPRRRRISAFEVALGVAFAAHAIALFAMRCKPDSLRSAPAVPLAFVDVAELLPSESFDSNRAEAPTDAPTAVSEAHRFEGQSRTRATTGAVAHLEWPSSKSAGSSDATLDPGVPNGESKASAESGPSLSLNQLGVGEVNPFLGDRPKPGEADTAESRLNDSLRAEIVDADVRVGLTRGGPIISALRLATFEVATPKDGTAGFVAITDTTGLVVTLEPTDVSSHHAAWQKVAERALVQLKSKRLRIPEGSKGLSVRLEVTSRVQLPSGRDPGFGVSALGVPIKKGDGKQSTRIDLLKPGIDLKTTDIPSSSAGDPQRLPTLKLGVNLFGLDGDPVDIGAKAQRTVRVRILNERPL